MSEFLKPDAGQPSPFAFVTVPGIGDSGPDHWQTWLEARLGDAQRVQVADWRKPCLEAWLDAIDCVLTRSGKPAILIAHSFGTLAAAQYAVEAPERIAGVLLVAPADPARFADGAKLSFTQLPCAGALVASRNDPWMALRVAERWAHIWGVPLIDEGDAGHINVASGHGLWLNGLAYLNRLESTARLSFPRQLESARERVQQTRRAGGGG